MKKEDLDIDSQIFEPQKYVRNYLKNNSVQDLIKHHNQLQSEIKDYDQEIQTLVFENYSKFISSIDTVRKMKTDIQKVDSKMSKLTDSMDRIAFLSKKIESSLSVKRDEIIKLDTVNKDLSKLNNVCNFPHIIQKDIDQYYKTTQKGKKVAINFDDLFNETASYYKQCFQMLENYKLEPLIQPIYKETTQKLEQVRQILWTSLMEFKQQNPLLQLYQHPDQIQISTQEARSAVKKLIYIMEDEEGVLKHYQKMIKERYLTITKELIDKATISKMVSGGFKPSSDSSTQLESNSQIDEDLIKFLEDKHFECPIEELEDYKHQKEKEYVNTDSAVQGSLLWLINQLCQVIFRELRVEVGFLLIEARAALREKQHETVAEQCIKEIIHGVFQGVTEKMSQKKINNFQVNEVFKKLQSELQSLFQRSEIRPQLRTEIVDKFSENVENICRGQVLSSFTSLRMSFLEMLSFIRKNLASYEQGLQSRLKSNDIDFLDLEGEAKREIMAQITILKQRLLATLLIRLVDLKAFVFQQQESYLREQQTYVHLIQGSLVDYTRFIAQVFRLKDVSSESLTNLSLMDPNMKDKYHVLYHVQEQRQTINHVFNHLFLQVFSKSHLSKMLNQMIEVFPGCGIRFEPELQRLQTIFNQVQKDNLVLFAQSSSEIWIESYFSPSSIQQINQVSEQGIIFAAQVKQLLINLAMLFPDQKRGIIKKQSIFKQQETGFNMQMEKIMVRKCRSIDIADQMSRTNVLNNILKYFLKIFLERVRRIQLMKKNQYQQIQIDLNFIVQIIYDLVSVDEEGLIVGFYLEILDCASQRSLDETKLDNKQIELISSQARNNIKI